jgi:hypothetical protein
MKIYEDQILNININCNGEILNLKYELTGEQIYFIKWLGNQRTYSTNVKQSPVISNVYGPLNSLDIISTSSFFENDKREYYFKLTILGKLIYSYIQKNLEKPMHKTVKLLIREWATIENKNRKNLPKWFSHDSEVEIQLNELYEKIDELITLGFYIMLYQIENKYILLVDDRRMTIR